jgi:hypothetical protein
MLFGLSFLFISGQDATAFQGTKKSRIYITKKDRKKSKKQKTDSVKVRRAQKAPRVQKERKPFKLGKPAFHGVLSGFQYLPQENAESNVNFGAGLEVSFSPTSRLQLFTGLGFNYIDQNYKIDDERVQGRLDNGAVLLRDHESSDIFVLGLEIPIGVRYKFKDTPNSLVVSFGFTTRTSIKEKLQDNISWKIGGFSGDDFIASSERQTILILDSPKAFEFLNVFSSGFLSLGKSFRVGLDDYAEVQLSYHFNVTGVKNIFQEVRFKKYESLGITLKYPLRFDRWFK